MKKLIIAIFAATLMSATAANAGIGIGAHVGGVGVGVHVGSNHHHARRCNSWGWRNHHHEHYCARWDR
ncbi:MAG: hypothetical protein WCA81_00225 [Rhizomicrobium sp.]